MKQSIALAILDAGHSAFLTGPAGSGKTYVLNQFIDESRANGKSVAVTASTGLAATHLGGSTIHSWAGIGIADELNKYIIDDMSKTRQDQINKADILIIDEISMLHDYRLDMIDQVCKSIRGDSAPFGSLQVVLSGDYYQLPPINREGSRQGEFALNSRAWDELGPVVCYLEEQHRQEEDVLLEILTALRGNDLRKRHVDKLMSRRIDRFSDGEEMITELYTKNINVDSVNKRKLDAMDGDIHQYEMASTGRKGAVESLKKSCLAPEILQLKIGALVMFVKNSKEKKYVNGTLGTVVSFDKDTGHPVVQIKSGKKINVELDTWETKDGEKKIATLSQFPLRLAWAITVHKSQGMTLDAAHIDLSNAFVPGMGYVALSRVRRLDDLSLGGLNRVALTMHEQAYFIDDRLRKQSHLDNKKYQYLENYYLEKIATKPKIKTTSAGKVSWQAKLEKMRQDYPNAYRRWKKIEDSSLLEMWAEGKSIKALSTKMGRHEGSIRARLKKHLGEELFK